jgi:5'-nucleotidase
MPEPPAGSADIAATPPTVEAAAPAAAPAPEAAPAAPAEGTHTIVAGDTLWAIAREAYGAGSKWKTIADANPEVKADDLTIGSTLKIPPAS